MPITQKILAIISAIILIEGLFILIYTKQTQKILKEMTRNKSLIKKIGIIEAVTGLILLIITLS